MEDTNNIMHRVRGHQHVNLEGQTMAIGLGSKLLYPLSYLIGPKFNIFQSSSFLIFSRKFMESLSSGDQVLLAKIIARILFSISQNIIKKYVIHYVFHVPQRFQCRYLISDRYLVKTESF